MAALKSAKKWLGRAASPWAVLVAVMFGIAVLYTTGPVFDVDSYWHVLIGRDIWTEARFSGDPAWVFGPREAEWTTTQWLSEVLMAGLVDVAGFTGLTLLRVVAAVTVLALLAHRTLHGKGSRLGRSLVFAVASFAVIADVQERPAALSFIFLVVLGGWAYTALETGSWPSWWVLAAVNVLWVNLHGYWVLLPVVITVVACVRAIDQRSVAGARYPVLLAAVTSAAGVASPAGLSVYMAPLTVSAAASPFIEEWGRSTVSSGSFCGLLLLMAFAVIAWVRSPAVPLAELLYTFIWFAFAVLAFRNVVPAVLLLAPLLAARCAVGWPHIAVRGTAVSATVAVLILLFSGVAGGVRLTSGDPLDSDVPLQALDVITDSPGERRVLNYYDLGGQLLALTRPGVRVAVDGRADLYGPERLDRYFDLLAGRPGWQETLAQYAATDALLPVTAPLVENLERLGWEQVLVDGDYVLLVAADTT